MEKHSKIQEASLLCLLCPPQLDRWPESRTHRSRDAKQDADGRLTQASGLHVPRLSNITDSSLISLLTTAVLTPLAKADSWMGITAGKEMGSSPPPRALPALPTLAGVSTVVISTAWSLDGSQLIGTLHV